MVFAFDFIEPAVQAGREDPPVLGDIPSAGCGSAIVVMRSLARGILDYNFTYSPNDGAISDVSTASILVRGADDGSSNKSRKLLIGRSSDGSWLATIVTISRDALTRTFVTSPASFPSSTPRSARVLTSSPVAARTARRCLRITGAANPTGLKSGTYRAPMPSINATARPK